MEMPNYAPHNVLVFYSIINSFAYFFVILIPTAIAFALARNFKVFVVCVLLMVAMFSVHMFRKPISEFVDKKFPSEIEAYYVD